MHRHLTETALLVFAEKGIQNAQIDDVVKAAAISRGGFYGHFRSMPELLGALGTVLGNETMQLIEERVVHIKDPAERIAHGLLLYLAMVRSYPLFARFIAVVGGSIDSPHSLVYEFLPPHIEAGNAARRLHAAHPAVAVDLIAGTMLVAVMRVAAGPTEASYDAGIVASILMGLGMSPTSAHKLSLMKVDLLTPPMDSLLMRSHQRHVAAQTALANP